MTKRPSKNNQNLDLFSTPSPLPSVVSSAVPVSAPAAPVVAAIPTLSPDAKPIYIEQFGDQANQRYIPKIAVYLRDVYMQIVQKDLDRYQSDFLRHHDALTDCLDQYEDMQQPKSLKVADSFNQYRQEGYTLYALPLGENQEMLLFSVEDEISEIPTMSEIAWQQFEFAAARTLHKMAQEYTQEGTPVDPNARHIKEACYNVRMYMESPSGTHVDLVRWIQNHHFLSPKHQWTQRELQYVWSRILPEVCEYVWGECGIEC